MTDVRSIVPSRRRPRAAPVLVAGLILLAFVPAIALAHSIPVAPRIGYAHPLAATTVTVSLTDAPSFQPASITVASNSTVDLHLVNVGNLSHSFTLQNLTQYNTAINRSFSPAQLDQYFTQYPPQANVTLAANTSAWVNLTYPASNLTRSFEFVSIVPYQFQAGMAGFLNVSSSGPAQVLYENTTNNLQFVPSVLAAAAASHGGPTTVDVQLTNLGNFPHTFTVVAQSNVSIGTTDYFSSHPPLVSVNVSPSSTTQWTGWANFTVPAPGVYEYVCLVPGHFPAGMYGFLYVGVPVPTPPPPPSTAVVEVGVLVGALVLLGIGAVLVVAAGFVGRFPRPPSTGKGHGQS